MYSVHQFKFNHFPNDKKYVQKRKSWIYLSKIPIKSVAHGKFHAHGFLKSRVSMNLLKATLILKKWSRKEELSATIWAFFVILRHVTNSHRSLCRAVSLVRSITSTRTAITWKIVIFRNKNSNLTWVNEAVWWIKNDIFNLIVNFHYFMNILTQTHCYTLLTVMSDNTK